MLEPGEMVFDLVWDGIATLGLLLLQENMLFSYSRASGQG